MNAYERMEKAYDIVKTFFQAIGILFLILAAMFLLLVCGLRFGQWKRFQDSRSEGYIAAEKLVKSKKLIGMSYDECISLMSEYNKKYDDVGYSSYKKYSRGDDSAYVILFDGGTAESDMYARFDICIYFDNNDVVTVAELEGVPKKG